MRILISGSSGFIGTKILKYFKDKKYKVYILFRFPIKKNSSKELDNVIYISELDEINLKFDIIIHLSSKSHSKNFSIKDKKENFYLTSSLIKFSKRINLKKFIFLSSIKVNGEYSTNNKISELSIPNPSSIYARSKYELEELIKNEFTTSFTEFYNIRIPLVVGEGAKGNLLSMMKIIRLNIPLPLKNINNKRSFISINDLINIFETIILLKKNKSGLYLASNNKSLSISKLHNYINKCFRKNNNYFYLNNKFLKFLFFLVGKKQSYIKIFNSFEIDNSKLIKELGFKSFSNIEEEIVKMVNSFINKNV
tara:strand:- start:400 stop:1326 length:927 start_codon:yes stop_codon:yes gene_type:complete